jgi:hypothetical protein
MIKIRDMMLDRIIPGLDECAHSVNRVLRRHGRKEEDIQGVHLLLVQAYNVDILLVLSVIIAGCITALR